MDLSDKVILAARKLPPIIPGEAKDTQAQTSFAALLERCITEKKNETIFLRELKASFVRLKSDEISSYIRNYLSQNEKNYLIAKQLAAYKNGFVSEKEKCESFYTCFGKPDYFNASLCSRGPNHFVFTLPRMESKYTSQRCAGDGRAMQYLVQYLLETYQGENAIHILHNPVAIFIHHFVSNSHIPDADNIDVKVTIDALQGFLFEDDTLLDLAQMQMGVLDNSAYTELHILEMNGLAAWLAKSDIKPKDNCKLP